MRGGGDAMSGQENAARLARATLETVHRIETDSSFLREFLRVPADRRACHPALAAGHLAAGLRATRMSRTIAWSTRCLKHR